MPHHALVDPLEKAMRLAQDPEKAAPMSAYMKNQFPFLGIPSPQRRTLAKMFSADLPKDPGQILQVARALYRLPEREFRYVAIDWVRKRERCFAPQDCLHFQKLLVQEAWWDTVDGWAGVVGDVLYRHHLDASNIMKSWISHSNFWIRRVALLHQLGWRERTNTEVLSAHCLSQAADPEFFIRKAIGWALRDYAHWDPKWVQSFVRAHQNTLSRLSIREALKNVGAS